MAEEEDERRTPASPLPLQALPQSAEACAEARRAAESSRDDAALLRLRRLERAHQGLPAHIDGARRQRLLWADAISTTWLAWLSDSGQPLLLRCLRPSWREDVVMQRRLARATVDAPPPLRRPRWCAHGDWPHLRLPLPGPLLSTLPPPAPLSALSLLGHTLAGLAHLHAAGHTLGGAPLADHLALTEQGTVELLWLDRFNAQGSPADDLRALARLAADLSPEGPAEAEVVALVADWQHSPPRSADDARWLLQRAMAAALLDARRALLDAQRHRAAQHRHQALARWAHRLALAAPPPIARACLWAPADPQIPPILALSDGQSLRGGSSLLPPSDAAELPLLAQALAPTDMDVAGCRALLRAPPRQDPRQEARRQALQAQFGGGLHDHDLLLRWLRARLQLRTLLLLMDRTGTGCSLP